MVRTYTSARVLGEVEKILDLGRGQALTCDRISNIRSYVAGMEATGCQPHDPVREFASFAADQWSSIILLVLCDGPFRYSMLHRLVGAVGATDGISQRILSLKLKKLHHNGLIERMIENELPPRVSYGLTPLGTSFVREIENLARWVIDKLPEINEARAAFPDEPNE